MARFILIDHSLKGIGGHHYEYAIHILGAAEAAGYAVALATHRRFRDRHTLPRHWPVFPFFRFHTYSKYSMNDVARTTPVDPQGAWADQRTEQRTGGLGGRLIGAWHRSAQQRRVDHFAAACGRLFRRLRFEQGDQVFLPTVSDFDLVGLVRYLRSDPATGLADWHLQFHFHFLDGRVHQYADQADRIAALRRHFARQLDQVPGHRLFFYATTREMADQYNRMEVRHFETLPYPVNAANRKRRIRENAGPPLRVTCAGGVRPEKGQQHLAPLIHALWQDLFVPGEIQLLVQSKKSRFSVPAPDCSGTIPMARWPVPCDGPLVDVPHPLDGDAYVRLIRETDIGLFLYDAETYHARCAGILVEMLAAGVPVIVPSGCWLAEQIAEPIRAHRERLRRALPAVQHVGGHQVRWRSADLGEGAGAEPRRRSPLDGARRRWMAELSIPAGATEVQLVFPWPEDAASGTFLRVDWCQWDSGGATVDRWSEIIGRPKRDARATLHLPCARRAARVGVTLRGAYAPVGLSLRDAEWWFLAFDRGRGGHAARGSVGLIAADPDQVPALLREMVAHYRHYASTAATFSHAWGEQHDPSRTVAILAARAEAARAARAA